eukprot:TRINITY_DN2153_c0_g2_i1.p1 TRINITY_DN2153_c0_g2~~TRINITY_DN2153_c0_g2_i1.p1  ORF type:complete len:316 (+),score=57.07 TRINITY_DN2153_c0_g2_i1:78-950(+)
MAAWTSNPNMQMQGPHRIPSCSAPVLREHGCNALNISWSIGVPEGVCARKRGDVGDRFLGRAVAWIGANAGTDAGQAHTMEESQESNNNGSANGYVYPLEPEERAEIQAIRTRLNKKLSEANMYNRHLLREVQARDAAIQDCKLSLASMEVELMALMSLAEEIAREGGRSTTRKINGKYIQSHLATRMQGLHKLLQAQIEDVDLMRTREVPLVWYGMAEDVKVMGSFDGWTNGEQMSPETTGTFTKFTCNLKLRPGKYEIKFCVDGEWRIAPQWPTNGEGMTMNNILLVE